MNEKYESGKFFSHILPTGIHVLICSCLLLALALSVVRFGMQVYQTQYAAALKATEAQLEHGDVLVGTDTGKVTPDNEIIVNMGGSLLQPKVAALFQGFPHSQVGEMFHCRKESWRGNKVVCRRPENT